MTDIKCINVTTVFCTLYACTTIGVNCKYAVYTYIRYGFRLLVMKGRTGERIEQIFLARLLTKRRILDMFEQSEAILSGSNEQILLTR